VFPASKPSSSVQELLAGPTPRRKLLLAEVLPPIAECSIAVPETQEPPITVKLNIARGPTVKAEAFSRLGRPRKGRSRCGVKTTRPLSRTSSSAGGGQACLPNPQRRQDGPVHDGSLWDAKAVSAYLKCSKSYVYKAAESGELPCVRIGVMLRFHPAQVRAFAFDEGN
jgi:excisionase family DNA binding protein